MNILAQHEDAIARNFDNDLNFHLESFKDIDDFYFDCEECGESKPYREMRFTRDHKDTGCCNDCSSKPDVATAWGFES